MAYRVKKAFKNLPELTTVVDGKRVALNQSYTHSTKGTPTKPPETITVPLATTAQLRAIFERGDPCVEQYEEAKMEEPRNLVNEYVPKNPFEGVPRELLEKAQSAGKKKPIKNEP